MNDSKLPSPENYLNKVLRIIEKRAYFFDNIADWKALRQRVLAMIEDATTTAETYAAIQTVLQELRDGHSFFLSPRQLEFYEASEIEGVGFLYDFYSGVVWLVYQDSPASEAGVRVGDILREINGESLRASPRFNLGDDVATLVFERHGETALIIIELEPVAFKADLLPYTRLLNTVGYIELPGLSNPDIFDSYAQNVYDLLRTMPVDTCGFILDLRRNTGGNMYPMIVSVGSLFRSGDRIGTFITRDGERADWFYGDNSAGVGDEVVYSLKTNALPSYANLPIAILTGNHTASSGEMTLISFLGRANVRTFGESTCGLTSANHVFELSDGAELVLATEMAADRNGVVYTEAIEPDETIEIQWATFGTSDDPVIIRAKQWLETTCAGQN